MWKRSVCSQVKRNVWAKRGVSNGFENRLLLPWLCNGLISVTQFSGSVWRCRRRQPRYHTRTHAHTRTRRHAHTMPVRRNKKQNRKIRSPWTIVLYMLHPSGILQEILFSFCCVDFMGSQTEVKVDYDAHCICLYIKNENENENEKPKGNLCKQSK